MRTSRLPAARLRVSLPILIILSSVVVMVATTLAASSTFYAQARRAIEAALTATARDKATEFELLLRSLRTEIASTAYNLSASRAAENLVTGLRIVVARSGPQTPGTLGAILQPAADGGRALSDFYGRAFDAMHAMLRQTATEGGFPEILFVEPGGVIAYSQARRSDLGSNVHEGALRGSILDRLVTDLLADPSGPIRLSDRAEYEPAGGHAAFFGTAVYANGGMHRDLLGVLVFQLPQSRVDALFGERHASDAATSALLVGSQGTVWSGKQDNRPLAEFNDTEAALRSPSPEGSVAEIHLAGRQNFVAAVPLAEMGQRWVMIAAEDAEAVLEPVWRMIDLAVGIGAIATLLLAALAAKVASRLAAPVLSLTERFDAALSNMPHGLVMIDAADRIILCNAAYRDMYELPTVLTAAGTPLDTINAFRAAQGMGPIEVSASLTDGGERRELADGRTILVMRNALPSGGFVATHQNLTDRVRAEKRITYLATHDVLTGLPNRANLESSMAAMVQHLDAGRWLPVLCLDLDRFKAVNDTLGHPVGDLLLQAVAGRMLECLQCGDVLTRLGGDEFVILQSSAHDPEDARRLAQTLIERVAEPFDIAGHTLLVGLSVGIAVAPTDGATAETLIKNADLALYRAKADGRGSARFFEPGMDAHLQARRQLELDLRHAIAAGQFELAYQPVYDARSETITGAEALVRWRHPERGMVSPAEFIPLAEERGLIVAIGEWVIRKACADAAAWPETVSIAVNLSAIQLKAPSLHATIAEALSASGLSPARLELEITETVLLEDNDATMATLHAFKRMGVRIAMDDFGTGYSSLSYLRSFPFDKIKIDQTFVRELGRREDAGAIIKAICDLATTLGMVTTAEGVETVDQFTQVRKQGCTLVQGYFMCRPTTAAEVARLLAVGEALQRIPA